MKNYLGFIIVIAGVLATACKKYTKHGIGAANEPKWIVTTIAGDGEPHFADGAALLSKFHAPLDITLGLNGALYVADALNHRIRKVENGEVTTVAGFGSEDTTGGVGTSAGYADPIQITSDAAGNLYTLDIHDYRIRKINSNTLVSVVAGSGVRGFANGRSDTARFGECSGITTDALGNIFVSDLDALRIRKISADGVVTTLAGDGRRGFVDANGEAAEFFLPTGIVLDKQGNLLVADWNRIRKISPGGDVTTFVGRDAFGFQDGVPSIATFTSIADMVIDAKGNLYITDENHIRKITPQGVVSTIAGNTSGYHDGEGSVAQFNGADGIGIDASGNLYVADANNNRIRKISLQ